MKIKLNIKSIVTAEKLLGKSFGKFNIEDAEEWLVLSYAMVVSNNEETFTLDTFRKLTKNKRMMNEIIGGIKKEFEYIEQFKGKDEAKTDEQSDISITEVACMMIANGIDPAFVYEMRTTEITDILQAIEDRKKEKMESDRFWTYFVMAPHIDTKKVKSPEALITFPWEMAEKKKKQDLDFEKAKANFEKFIKSK